LGFQHLARSNHGLEDDAIEGLNGRYESVRRFRLRGFSRTDAAAIAFYPDGFGVTTPNVKNRTLRKLDHSFEAAKGRRNLNEPLRRRPAACQV